MTNAHERMGRLAVASIVAVISFIALNNACGVMPDVIVWWLLYCVGCGVILNSEAGDTAGALATMSLLPAIVPIAMSLFFVLVGQTICLSFPNQNVYFALPIVSWFSIFVFSFARAPLVRIFEVLVSGDAEERTKRLVSVVQLIVSGVAALVLLIASIGD